MQENLQTESILTIEQNKKITMTGVQSVDAFSDGAISLTVGGKRVKIEGANLKILTFSQGSGNFAAGGEVVSVRYGGSKGKSLSKLLK